MRNSILAALAIVALVPAAQAQSPYGLPTLAPSGQPPSDVTRQTSPEKILIVPAQTEAAVQLLSGIHTQVSHVGGAILAQLLQPVYVNGRVALPRGSLLDGRITRIRPAGRLRRPAELSLRFERITLPDGQDQPIAAVLTALDAPAPPSVRLDSEGQLKGTKPISWKGLAGGLVGLGALAGVQTQLAGAAALGAGQRCRLAAERCSAMPSSGPEVATSICPRTPASASAFTTRSPSAWRGRGSIPGPDRGRGRGSTCLDECISVRTFDPPLCRELAPPTRQPK